MKKIALLFLCVLLAGSSFCQNFFTTNGKQIIGLDGKPFLMKGTNLGNWLVPEGYMFHFQQASSPRLIQQTFNELLGPAEASEFWKKYLDVYITAADIHYLKQIGMNSIRIPFNYRLFTSESYMGSSDPNRGFRYLDRVLNWCRQEQLYVILDMHCAPGGQTGDNIDDGDGYPQLFLSEGSKAMCINIWKKIAAHYKSNNIIIGYDLLNEPIAHYFDKSLLNPLLEPLYKQITQAIRTVDPHHLIFLGGAQWDSNFEPFGKPFDDKLVYTFHKYWTSPTKAVIQDYLDFSNKYQVPLYCGETGENEDTWVDSFRMLLDSNQIGWHYWPYKKLDNSRGIVTFSIPPYYDSVIKYANTPRYNFDDIRKNRPADMKAIKQALEGYLNNCRFANCIQNKGYIRALGFKQRPE